MVGRDIGFGLDAFFRHIESSRESIKLHACLLQNRNIYCIYSYYKEILLSQLGMTIGSTQFLLSMSDEVFLLSSWSNRSFEPGFVTVCG